MSAIGSLAPWFGGKRTMSATIAAAIGPHRSYWEPFCGSMAVLLGKPAVSSETVNDLHSDLTNLARVIQHPTLGAAFYRRLRRTLFSEGLFRDSREVILSPTAGASPDVDRACHYFIYSWMGLNGTAGTAATNGNFCRRFSSSGGDAGIRFLSAVGSIPAWRKRLERVVILQSDGIELCERIEDREGTAIYCDPPYLVKGAKYVHDFASEDHSRLALTLRRFEKTRVVVSYYDHPRLADLYPGWRVLRLDVTKGMVNSGKRGESGATKAPEILLVNQIDPVTQFLF